MQPRFLFRMLEIYQEMEERKHGGADKNTTRQTDEQPPLVYVDQLPYM